MTIGARPKPTSTRALTLTRVVDAPRELVFKMWTDPRHMAQWWGPKGFTNPVCELDARPGGKILIHMRAPDGAVHPMRGTFREVKPPERLVFVAEPVDHEGNVLIESVTAVTFEDQGGKTKLTVEASAVGFAPVAAKMLGGMETGWTQSLERLAELVGRTRPGD